MTCMTTMMSTQPDQAASTTVAMHPRTILVAEDEHLLAQHLEADLKELGYEVIGPASNGRRAVELARKHHPDMALLDLRMPEMDGFEAAEILYNEQATPIVVVSAYSDREYVERMQKLGVFGYLLKPVSLDELRVTIGVSWGRYRQQVDLSGQVSSLERKLEERKVIERAKGVIMQTLGISEPEAMRRLQKQARDSRRPMAELAKAVLDAHGILDHNHSHDKPGSGSETGA